MGARAGSLGASMERRERKKWGQGPGGGLGRGQRQLGIASPTPGEASVGSFEATSEVLPLPGPRLPPHQTATGEKVGKDAKILKYETPGQDPPSDPSPRHNMGERSPCTCVSLSL